nr:hypothetical protein [Tanacetum cinerariifolium]
YVVSTGRVVVPTGRYVVSIGRVVVPTGRVVVLTGRYVVLTGIVVVTTGRVVVPNGRVVVPTGRVVVLTGSFDVVVKERTTATTITEVDQFLIDELFEVQNVFHQMEQAVEQHRVESKTFQVKMNKVLNENERLLEQVISKDIVNIVMTSTVNNAYEPVHECERSVKLETELQNDFIEREIYNKLFKRYTTLEKHCISLEVNTQLNQEIFQRDNSFL